MAVEQASYKIVLKEGPFEVRLYDPMIVATCRETDLAGGDGFNRIFSYINGNNRESMKIAMTAPVINYLEDQQSTTAFVMPVHYRLSELPQPNDPALQIKEIHGRQVAAVSFLGTINARVISMKKIELQKWLQAKHLIAIGVMELARYSAPYIPVFIRRNDLMIEIQSV